MRVTRRGMIIACLTGALLGVPVAVQTADAGISKNLRPCLSDDGPGPCYWDAANRGNGKGRSFTIDKHGFVHYVKVKAPRKQSKGRCS